MEKIFRKLIVAGGLWAGLWACIEIYPIKPKDLPESTGERPGSMTICQAPSIEGNIVGAWHFESTYNRFRLTKPDTVTSGTVTFTAKTTIIDPDSLFENSLEGYPVIAKTYIPKKHYSSGGYTGDIFEVTVKTKNGKYQIDYLTVVSNECNRIHLRQLVSGGNGSGLILTRL